MKEVFLGIAMITAIFLFAPATVSRNAIGSGHRVVIILAQSVEQEINQEIEQELPSDQGTSQEEMGSGQNTRQDTDSTQGNCTGPADCPGRNEATAPDNN